jgi:hypothetical protein
MCEQKRHENTFHVLTQNKSGHNYIDTIAGTLHSKSNFVTVDIIKRKSLRQTKQRKRPRMHPNITAGFNQETWVWKLNSWGNFSHNDNGTWHNVKTQCIFVYFVRFNQKQWRVALLLSTLLCGDAVISYLILWFLIINVYLFGSVCFLIKFCLSMNYMIIEHILSLLVWHGSRINNNNNNK